MNQHALGVLEFDAALSLVAGHASSALGAERIRELKPRSDRQWIEREHARVSAMKAMVEGDASWHPQQLVDIRPGLARLRVEGASLSAAELLECEHFFGHRALPLKVFATIGSLRWRSRCFDPRWMRS
jgi:dsDNA-specific endonuclease/ATPase MutS2